MVTVVDAVNFLKDYDEAKYLQDVGESLGEEDERSVADLLVDQVEFADIILISKTDLVDKKDIKKLTAVLKTLNTDASIVPISNGNIDTDKILNTGLFNFERAQQSPGWLKEMRGEHIPETEEYGISSFVYEARRPFYPKKFFEFQIAIISQENSYGQRDFLARYSPAICRKLESSRWDRASWVCWNVLESHSKSRWPKDQESLDYINENWVEPFGDMRQELVFIGQNLDKNEVIRLLDNCLLSDIDMLKGKDHWLNLPDPFPVWGESS